MKKKLCYSLLLVFLAMFATACQTDSSQKGSNATAIQPNKEQYDPSDEYDVMVEEFALKVDRIEDLILDMSDSNNPFAYVKQIETLAAECEKLHKKLKAAPLDSRQRLYVNEIYAGLEDLVRKLTWN